MNEYFMVPFSIAGMLAAGALIFVEPTDGWVVFFSIVVVAINAFYLGAVSIQQLGKNP